MATEFRRLSIFLFLVLPLFFRAEIHAQDAESAAEPREIQQIDELGYQVQTDENGDEYIAQRFEWNRVEFIDRYELVLEEKAEDGEFVPVSGSPFVTKDNVMDMSLPAGTYRYCVSVFNFFGKAAFTTDMTEFTLKKAVKPKIDSVRPDVIYLDEENDGKFTVSGRNFLEDSVFSLDFLLMKYGPKEVSSAQNGRSAHLLFDPGIFDTGTMNLTVTNPGGFASRHPVTVKFKKWYDLDVAVGYSPALSLYDETIGKYFSGNDEGFGFFPLGADALVNFLPVKRRIGYFGGGIKVSFFRLTYNIPEYSVSSNVFNGSLMFVYQRPLYKRKLILELHGGAGIFAFQNMYFEFVNGVQSEPLNSLSVSVSAGMSVQFYITKRLYAEAGCDFVHVFGYKMPSGLLLPAARIGWQF